jgi:hypothetical protein
MPNTPSNFDIDSPLDSFPMGTKTAIQSKYKQRIYNLFAKRLMYVCLILCVALYISLQSYASVARPNFVKYQESEFYSSLRGK